MLANVNRSMLAERILEAAKAGERNPAKLRAHAIAGGLEAGLQVVVNEDSSARRYVHPAVADEVIECSR